MNRRKWQGTACLLLASLMMHSVFAAPVRKAVPSPQATTAPKTSTAPQATTTPKVTMPQQTTTPQVTTPPQATMIPKVTSSPQTTTTPKVIMTPQTTTTPEATTVPKPVECPKVAPCPKATMAPKASEMPKKETTPTKPSCTNVPYDEKKVEKQKPFTLDHFKMIINTLKKMGVEENKIITYIKEGKKLEDILKAEKISAKKFKKCIIKEYFKVVDEAGNNGQITAEQCKQLKTAIKETIKNWLPKK